MVKIPFWAFLIPFLTPLLGFVGNSLFFTLLFVFVLSRLVLLFKSNHSSTLFILPFLCFILAWVALSLISQFSVELWSEIGARHAFQWGADWGLLNVLVGVPGLSMIFLISCSFLFLTYLLEERERISIALWGAVIGSFFSLVYSLVYWKDLFLSQGTYWQELSRHSGLFSDPNALGISAFVIIVANLLLVTLTKSSAARVFLVTNGLAWLGFGLFSGSRSFILALLAFFLAFAYFRSKKNTLILVLLAAFSFVLWNLASIEQLNLVRSYLPDPLDRILLASRVDFLEFTFSSRIIFWKGALYMLGDVFPSAIGPGQFLIWFPSYANALGLGTGIWSDSANNFYLQAVIELGLVGLILIAIGTLGFKRFKDQKPLVLQIWLSFILSFALILLLGSHLAAIEVSLMAIVVLSVGLSLRFNLNLKSKLLILLLSIAALVYAPINFSKVSYGIYPWEQDAEGPFRWSSADFRFFVDCDSGENPRINVRAVQPVSLEISIAGVSRALAIGGGELVVLDSLCSKRPIDQRIEIGGKVDSPFVPALQYPQSLDWRLLGVQIRSEQVDSQRAVP